MITLRLVAVAALLFAIPSPHAVARDNAVSRAQEALKQAGHDPGPIDGVMGGRTAAALRAYQQAQGLDPTGRLDEATLARLGGVGSGVRERADRREKTGGDTRPSAVDPAQASKTGANAGEGASYSRSTEKGLSSEPSASPRR